VLLENRPIGRSDRDGMLLVTPLNAWQRNRIAIDPMELPADVQLGEVEVQATPKDRSGTLVRFAIDKIRPAVLVLRNASGQPLPLGSRVRLSDGGDAIVGYDGEAYLDRVGDANDLRVDTPSGACRVRFAYPRGPGIPRIGPLSCVPERSP
jgi:outer membrane usher protein